MGFWSTVGNTWNNVTKKDERRRQKAARGYLKEQIKDRKQRKKAATTPTEQQALIAEIESFKQTLKQTKQQQRQQFWGKLNYKNWQQAPQTPIQRAAAQGTRRGRLRSRGGLGSFAAGLITHDASRIKAFLVLAVFYHLWIVTVHPALGTRLLANIFLFGILGFFAFTDSQERNKRTLSIIWMLIVFECAYPLLIGYLANFTNLFPRMETFLRYYIASGLLPLTWVYYVIFGRAQGVDDKFLKFSFYAIVFFWAFVIFSVLSTAVTPLDNLELDGLAVNPYVAITEVVGRSWDGVKQAGNIVVGMGKGIWNIFDTQRKQITSEYYAGVVDENENEQLGVYLKNIKASKPEFFRDERVNLYATLETKTLEDSIDVEVQCYAGKKKKTGNNDHLIRGQVQPDKSFTVVDLQQEEIDCQFLEGSLPKGSQRVAIAATYNFETIGYIKRFFMDRDALNAAKREGLDPLQELKIKDQQPFAKYTNGPVKIGIGPEQQVIGVSEADNIKPRLGITLDGQSGWTGHIKKINEIVVLIPDEMTLDIATCTDPSFREYTLDDCVSSHKTYRTKQEQECGGDASCLTDICEQELSGHNAYYLDTSINPNLYEDLESYITFSCRLNIEDIPGLLGNTPISTQYFYVKARYDYETEKEGAVYIKKETTSGVEVTRARSYSNDEEMLRAIYLQTYYTNPHVQNAIQQHFPTLDPHIVMAMIGAKSKNDPYYVGRRSDGTEERGLMHLRLPQIAQAKQLLGETTTDVFDAQQNILLGVRHMSYLNSLPATKSLEDVLAAYYSGEIVLENDKWRTDSSLLETKLYVDLVKAYTQKIKELEFVEEGQLLPLLNIDNAIVNGTVDISSLSDANPTISHAFMVDSIPFTLIITKGNSQNNVELRATYDGIERSLGKQLFSSTNNAGTWVPFKSGVPFFRFRVENNQISYRVLRESTINTVTLIEGNTKYTVWKDLVKISYDGNELHLFLTINEIDQEFCEIQWGRNVISETCDPKYNYFGEVKAKGITVKRITRSEGLENSLGTGHTQVQVTYDLGEQLQGAAVASQATSPTNPTVTGNTAPNIPDLQLGGL